MQDTQARRGRKFRPGFLLGAAIFFLTVRGVHAAEYFELPLEQLLDTKVYSASKQSKPLSDTPAAVYVITRDDIERSGVTTIPEALRMAPGVVVARQSADAWAISIRGFNAVLANKILVMIDGRTIYNPLHSGTYWEAQNLMLEDIDRIEVVRGPGGALWGTNAVNGVINIITKSARMTQGNLVSTGYGNHERGFANARHGGSFGDDGFYRMYANYFRRDSFRSENLPGSAPDDWEGYRTGFRMDWSPESEDSDVMLSGHAYHVDSGQYYQDYSLTAPYLALSEETAVNKGGHLLARWEKDIGGGALMTLQSFLDYAVRDETLLKDDRVIFDVESQYNFAPSGRHDVIAGAGFRYMIDDLSGSNLVTFDPPSRADPIFSAFIRDKITLDPRHWYLTLGAKFEHNFYTGFEVQPNARLQWHPDDKKTFWAAVSRAVRTPSRIERDLILTNLVVPPGGALGGLPTEVRLVNNPDFDSEKLVAYEAGYRHQITPDLSLDAAFFYNEYDDLRSTEALGASVIGPPAHLDLPLIVRNDMSGETYGAEVAASWNVADNWKLSGTYSYLETYLHAPRILGQFTQENPEGRVPVHQASLRSGWNIDEQWSLDTSLYYVDEFRTWDVPSYIRLDINLGWKMAKGVKFNLIGQNLLDGTRVEYNPTGNNTSEIGTSVFGKVTWEF